jgi:hypothetical protein
MACKHCEGAQESWFAVAGTPHELPSVFVRIGTGNIQILGCDKHVKELLEKLRK